MLIIKSPKDKSRSIYKCDMCNREVNINEVNKINITKPYKFNKKYWDLCNKCLNKLISSINKYSQKKEDKL